MNEIDFVNLIERPDFNKFSAILNSGVLDIIVVASLLHAFFYMQNSPEAYSCMVSVFCLIRR